MKVEKDLKKIWSDNYLRGDVDKIYILHHKKLRKENIRICIKEGEWINEAVFEAVKSFYERRVEKNKSVDNSSRVNLGI